MDEKSGLPPYTDEPMLPTSTPHFAASAPSNCSFRKRSRPSIRRSRVIRFFTLACLLLIVLSQWKQVWRAESKGPKLSIDKLNDNLQSCKKLRSKPQDPVGLGRKRNARYIDGHKATLIKNATIWVGEPVQGTSPADARAGKGWTWISGDVLLEHGLIKRVEHHIASESLGQDTIVYDAAGRQLTSGIIDMHSHSGVSSLPGLEGNEDTNELSDNITPWARSIDGVNPLDHQLQVIKSGGVTTSLVLPGSANNIGGEAFLFKHAVGKDDGRTEISAVDMLADPERNWRYMKMACGENAKRVHGSGVDRLPSSRLGESYAFRTAFETARDLIQKQNDWCDKAEDVGAENMEEYLPQPIKWETLTAALRGQVHINVHCYTIPDLEAMVDHTNEFKFAVRAFHHAHSTFLVPEILKRTWGGRAPASAIFANNMYYKAESYVGSQFAGKYLYEEGLTPVYVSDNPVLNAQHVLFEAAKGYHWGLPYHAALASVTTAPAEELGMGQRLGKVKPGFDADIVVWDSDPLSIGATPVQVWIDGTAQYKSPVELQKPLSSPIVPKESLKQTVEEPTEHQDAFFTGVTSIWLSGYDQVKTESSGAPFNVAITNGKVSCVGTCKPEFEVAKSRNIPVVAVKNGHLTNTFTAVGGTLGLSHIDAEKSTNNGDSPTKFTRAIDGLALDGKKLVAASQNGVTKAITAPQQARAESHFGTSVGFVTTAKTSLDEGAVFAQDIAVHYSLTLAVRDEDSYTGAFGSFRAKLLGAVKKQTEEVDDFTEAFYLQQVIKGEKTLAVTINSADSIATFLRIKSEVEKANKGKKLKVAILGGAESHLVASALASSGVGVILTPRQPVAGDWDKRRALSGAPLTNGTTLDKLIEAGVPVGLGINGDWQVYELRFEVATAHHNSNGKINEREALALAQENVYKILGQEVKDTKEDAHFIMFEGNPMDIDATIKAVGSGRGQVAVFV